MKKLLFAALFCLFSFPALAQNVTVSPDNVNVYSQGATSVYLTFNNVANVRPAESAWCGALISAAPDAGFRCDPATVFGSLPARYDQSRWSGGKYTDIMSVTPAVARRAYLDAVKGNDAQFFYVRHFVSTNGGLDQFVAVTIRLSGNGAGVPFSLTNVKLLWQNGEKVVPFIKPSEPLPKITAEIRYTGTGRLKGRWELVKPGESLPDRKDLLSEATLPPEERGTQKRFTLLNRFNVYLPPGGRYVLPGPENWRIDKTIEGMYLLLLRVEASDAPESASKSGAAAIETGGVAGFPMPVLRYYVGNSSNAEVAADFSNEVNETNLPVVLSWQETAAAALYRIEIKDDEKQIFAAILPAKTRKYELPSFLREQARAANFQWRVVALNAKGEALASSPLIDLKK